MRELQRRRARAIIPARGVSPRSQPDSKRGVAHPTHRARSGSSSRSVGNVDGGTRATSDERERANIDRAVRNRAASTTWRDMHLLTLDARETDLLVDALVAFATGCELAGDDVDARLADELCDRARALRSITSSSYCEWVRHAGVGPHRQKPQG